MTFFARTSSRVGEEGHMIKRFGALKEGAKIRVVRENETSLELEGGDRKKGKVKEVIRKSQFTNYVIFHPKEPTFGTAENPLTPEFLAFPTKLRGL